MEVMCSLNVVESMLHFVFVLFVFLGVFLVIIVLYPTFLIFMFKFDSYVEEMSLHNLACRRNRTI